jgi:hypothetical protein
MIHCRRTLLAALLAVVLITLSVPAVAETINVSTFNREFFNWADVHEQTFTFPEQQLYSQVLCNIVIACPQSPADCDPWDRLGWLRLKHEVSPGVFEDYELVRFITPYDITFDGGPGSCGWQLDLTDYQFLLHDEVTLKMYIETWMGNDNGWVMTVGFQMTTGIPDREPFAIAQLYSGRNVRYGDPDNPVSDNLPMVPITVPEETTWAAAKIFATGHGFLNTDNAAEFSNKWQRLRVDTYTEQHYLWRNDCEHNECSPQQGTWLYDRAGWCPGDKAEPWTVDLSDWVTPGGTHDMVLELQPYENWCRPNNPDCVSNGSCECPGHASYHIMGQVVFYRQTTTEVGDGRPQDAVLHLVGNYPNPFNPQTTIQYHLAKPGDVTVSVFDAEGNLVCAVERNHAVGLQTWTWQGRDNEGRLVPSGVYLYEVRAGTDRVGGKMLLLK